MTNKISILAVFLISISASVFAQKEDPTLFSVEDTPVRVSEFKYIYDKTNGDDADYSKASLEEYLDLYEKFKLKVQKARDMKLDTIPSLQQELAGYRQQLADSYLLDREVLDKLVAEAYERTKQDADISHIMIAVAPNATTSVEKTALERLQGIKEQLEKGEKTFETLAREYSDDGSSKGNGGRVGYITAVLPNGFYALEKAAYDVPVGQVSDIVRSGFGYHLVKVNDRRAARGEMEVAHILVRKDKNGANTDQAKAKAMKIYDQLQGDVNFEELAKQVSEDKLTSNKGGYLGLFGVNKYEDSFEDAAFALASDGAISKPVETKAGFHIIKRMSKRGIQPFKEVKGRLEQKIRQDNRFELAKQSMVERIKKENNFTQTTAVLKDFKDTLNNDFLTFKWRVDTEKPKDVLFNLGTDYRATLGEFMDFAQKAARQRINEGRSGKTPQEVADNLYDAFVVEQTLRYEEQQLEEKYPDFKSLMREYEEGILLFEATKMLVWDKASQDTTGLKAFFKTVDGKYKWDDRAVVTTYNVASQGVPKIAQIRSFVKDHSVEESLKQFNTGDAQMLFADQKTIEKGRDKKVDALDWEAGTLSDNEGNKQTRSLTFMKIEKIIPPTSKTLQEARGYVVADYQDHLEKEWVKSLRKEYDLKVNKRVFNRMVQKK
ncbi:MAG: peptidylprolyl isomerase [Bacteroidota bacterium]